MNPRLQSRKVRDRAYLVGAPLGRNRVCYAKSGKLHSDPTYEPLDQPLWANNVAQRVLHLECRLFSSQHTLHE